MAPAAIFVVMVITMPGRILPGIVITITGESEAVMVIGHWRSIRLVDPWCLASTADAAGKDRERPSLPH